MECLSIHTIQSQLCSLELPKGNKRGQDDSAFHIMFMVRLAPVNLVLDFQLCLVDVILVCAQW
jgi:hypothetical protein